MTKTILASVGIAALLSMSAAHAESPLAGIYGGIQGGYDIYDFGPNGKGVEGGVFLGYNAPIGDKFLVGAETNFDLSDANSAVATAKVRNSYGVNARAGFLATDNVLVYARGGYVRSSIRVGVAKDTFDGYSLGGGIEASVLPNVSVRAEYIYNNYTTHLGVEPTQQQMNLGVAYHF